MFDSDDLTEKDKDLLVDLFIRYTEIGCDLQQAINYTKRTFNGETIVIETELRNKDEGTKDQLDWITYIFSQFIDDEI